MSDKLKVMTIVGTRPEIIRLSKVMFLLDRFVEHKIVHTGQNYDYELNEIFFKELGVRKPDYFLNVDTTSLGTVYGWTLIKAEEVLKAENPDAVLILGDTNSAIACIMAKRLKIPIYHMEAGNRCFDFNVPEEINRRIIDHISDFNLVYTEHARRNLIAEGFPARRTYLTGSPIPEVLESHMDSITKSDVLSKLDLEKGKYLLVSMHREENVDSSENLSGLLRTLELAAERFACPVIVSTHPRTKNRLKKLGNSWAERIHFLKPFGFFDYVNLQMNAKCVISDSGTISEEASILDFPAVTIRNAMERPEALDFGRIILTGIDTETIISSIELQIDDENRNARHDIPNEYKVKDVSWRVVKLILGTAKLSNAWGNIKQNDLS